MVLPKYLYMLWSKGDAWSQRVVTRQKAFSNFLIISRRFLTKALVKKRSLGRATNRYAGAAA
jgi:hypothetical protein